MAIGQQYHERVAHAVARVFPRGDDQLPNFDAGDIKAGLGHAPTLRASRTGSSPFRREVASNRGTLPMSRSNTHELYADGKRSAAFTGIGARAGVRGQTGDSSGNLMRDPEVWESCRKACFFAIEQRSANDRDV